MSNTVKTDTQAESYLRFSLHKESYAIPLLSVREVIAVPDVTPLPNTPRHFLGIMNLRGQIISIIDLRSKFGIKNEIGPETTVIICDIKPFCIGIVVNSVDSVLTVGADAIKPKPEVESDKKTDYITGVVSVDSDLVLLIDIAKALDVAEQQVLYAQARKAA